MDGELHSVPDPEHSDSPERLQESLYLAKTIDTQLDDWQELAISRHPVMRRNMARKIIANCTPTEEVVDEDVNIFEEGLTPQQLAKKQDKLKQHATIAALAQDEQIDTISVTHEAFRDYFERLDAFSRNPETPEEFSEAVLYVRRLFTLREQLNIKYNNELPFDVHPYSHVLERTVNDIIKHPS